MNRKDIIAVVNDQILPQINKVWSWRDIAPAKELVNIVQNYRRDCIKAGTAKKDDHIKATVKNGFLYLDNKPITRIAPKDPAPAFNEITDYWENKILARQEKYFD